MITSLSLHDPATGNTVVLQPRDGMVIQGFAFDPSVRETTTPRVGGHGTRDTTALFDAGAVSVSMAIWDGRSEVVDELASMSLPAARPVLIAEDDEWAEARQVTLRFDTQSAPYTADDYPFRRVVCSWKAPLGMWEAVNARQATIPAMIPSDTGLEWSAPGLAWTTSGLVWPASSVTSPSQLLNPGSADANWQALLYGPCNGPALWSDTAQVGLRFKSGLSLGAGEFVLIDSASHAAWLNGDTTADARSYMDFRGSDWFRLGRGVNLLRYNPASGGNASCAVITYRPVWPA